MNRPALQRLFSDIKDGKVDSKRDGSLGYYTLDKAISDFKK